MAVSYTLADRAREAGVIGAGGAGFPAHVKVGSQADTVIANGAECEPLLYKDTLLMTHHPERVIAGLRFSMDAVGARRGVVGLKAKRKDAIAALSPLVDQEPDIELLQLGDYYPSGDEYELVYQATGRLIPPLGIPLHVGAVVHNVESLAWLADAMDGWPVTDKVLTVNGAVAEPKTFSVPLGTSFQDCLDFCGGATVADPVALVGGVMMGRTCDDFNDAVTRTVGGLIVLDRSHPLMQRKLLPRRPQLQIGKSGCDQCYFCTELCPRYLLGYDVQPHKVMRSLGFVATGTEVWSKWGLLCCACGICTLYACPELLFPKEACDQAKEDLRAAGITWKGREDREITPHPMQEHRRLPVKKLVVRLGLRDYDVPAPWSDESPRPRQVSFPLSGHIGAPAQLQVTVGDRVERGQVLAEIPEGKLGARVHSSVDGHVVSVEPRIVIETEAG